MSRSQERMIIELSEHQRVRVLAPPPSDEDLELARRLTERADGAHLDCRWLVDGMLDIRASSWVGVVQFSQVDVCIVPKLVGGALRVLQMLEYASGINMLRRLPADRPLPSGGRDLFDLIALLLQRETTALIHQGLLRDYRQVDDDLGVLRGRLRHRDQYLRRFGQMSRLECSFDEYDADIPANQLLAAALAVVNRRVREPSIRLRCRGLAATFEEVCAVTTFDPVEYEASIRYDRRTERYRTAHELAKLILRGVAFEDVFERSRGKVTAFLLDMNVIFEQFVARLVRDALQPTPLQVANHHRLDAVVRDDRTGRSYSTLIPDLVVADTRRGAAVPVDVKYKSYDLRRVSTSDIYQSFVYALALCSDSDHRRAGVVFPVASDWPPTHLSVVTASRQRAATICAIALNVSAILEGLRDQRDEVLARVRAVVTELTGFAVA